MRDPCPRTRNIMVQKYFNDRAQEQRCPESRGWENPCVASKDLGFPLCGSCGVTDYTVTNVLNRDPKSSESMSAKHIFLSVGTVHYKGDHSYKGKSLRH